VARIERTARRANGGSWVSARPSARGSASRAPRTLERDGPAQPRAPVAPRARSIFDEWLVLREVSAEGERPLGLPLSHAEDVARALRGALLCHAVDPPPAALSGHSPDGRRLERPHAAFLALPSLRPPPEGSDGERGSAIAGAAIVLPRGIDTQDRQAILLAAARWERNGLQLRLGGLGVMQLARADEPAARAPLDLTPWSGPSRHWATLTPIALPRNPGDLAARTPAKAARAARRAEEIVASACAHVGLPRPAQVRVMRRSRFAGVPSAPEFMPYPRSAAGARSGSNRFQRVCVHAELEFGEEVEGPVLLGAGRYFGVGLLRRLTE